MSVNKPLLIWCNAFRSKASEMLLVRGLEEYEVLFDGTGPTGIPSNVNVIFGHPEPERLLQLDQIEWVHIDSAGYTPYDTPRVKDFLLKRGIPLTNSSAVYSEPCAQHLLAAMLVLARQMIPAVKTPGEWSQQELRRKCHLLRDQTVLILGYGNIGKRLVELLQPFGLRILAARRTVSQPMPGVELIPLSALKTHLGEVDHLVNILPENESTRRIVDRDFLRRLKTGAVFYNIGRGATVDQSGLIEVLEIGHLRACFLDVTDPEPLPANHRLWTAPNCYITPHTAGGHETEFIRLADHFLQNLSHWVRGENLIDRVF